MWPSLIALVLDEHFHVAPLLAQAEMIHRSSLASLPEPQDVADVKREYERLLRTARAL